MHGSVTTPDAAEQERRQSLYGHLEHKEVGSPEWCWQMLEKLKNLWNRKARSAEELQRTMKELFPSEPWLVIPSHAPYGTSEAMLRANGIDPDELLDKVSSTRQRVQEAAEETTGEVRSRGGDQKSLAAKSIDNLSIGSQQERAQQNGVGIVTQKKLDYLARERPDLLEKVRAGDLSTHGAYIEAGKATRNPRVAIPIDNPQKAAEMLKDRMTPEQIDDLISHLEV